MRNHRSLYSNYDSDNRNNLQSRESSKKLRESLYFHYRSRKSNNSIVNSSSGAISTTNNLEEIPSHSLQSYRTFISRDSSQDNECDEQVDELGGGHSFRREDSSGFKYTRAARIDPIYINYDASFDTGQAGYGEYKKYVYCKNDKTVYQDENLNEGECNKSYKSEKYSQSEYTRSDLRCQQKRHLIDNRYTSEENFRITVKNDLIKNVSEFHDVPITMDGKYRCSPHSSSITMDGGIHRSSLRYSSNIDSDFLQSKDVFMNYAQDSEKRIYDIRAKGLHDDQSDNFSIDEESHSYRCYGNDFSRDYNLVKHSDVKRPLLVETGSSPKKERLFYENDHNGTYSHDYKNILKLHDRSSTGFTCNMSNFPSMFEDSQILNRDTNKHVEDYSPVKRLHDEENLYYDELRDHALRRGLNSSAEDAKRTLNIKDIRKILDIVEQFTNESELSTTGLQGGSKVIDDDKSAMQCAEDKADYRNRINLNTSSRNHSNSDMTEEFKINQLKIAKEKPYLCYENLSEQGGRESLLTPTDRLTIKNERSIQDRVDRHNQDSLRGNGMSRTSEYLLDELYGKDRSYRRDQSQSSYQDKLIEYDNVKKFRRRNVSKPEYRLDESCLKRKDHSNMARSQRYEVRVSEQNLNKKIEHRPSSRNYENRRDRKSSIEAMLIDAGNKAVSQMDALPMPLSIHALPAPNNRVPIQHIFPVVQPFYYPRFSFISNNLATRNSKSEAILYNNNGISGIFNPATCLNPTSSFPLTPHVKSPITKSSDFKKLMSESQYSEKSKRGSDSCVRREADERLQRKSSRCFTENQKPSSDLKTDSTNRTSQQTTSEKKSKKRFPKWFDKDCRELYIKRKKLSLMLERSRASNSEKNQKHVSSIEHQLCQVKKLLSAKIKKLKGKNKILEIKKKDVK